MLRATSLVLVFVAATRAAELPSCSADEENCVQEGMDLSPEGIAACLKALPSRSEACSAYLKLMDGCAADLEREGVCGDAAANGEAVPCLVQRTKPEDLSAACQAALPPVEEVTGLAKYWVDGKREVSRSQPTWTLAPCDYGRQGRTSLVERKYQQPHERLVPAFLLQQLCILCAQLPFSGLPNVCLAVAAAR